MPGITRLKNTHLFSIKWPSPTANELKTRGARQIKWAAISSHLGVRGGIEEKKIIGRRIRLRTYIHICGPATWPALVYSVAASSNFRLSRAKVTRVSAGSSVRHLPQTLPPHEQHAARRQRCRRTPKALYTTPCFRTARHATVCAGHVRIAEAAVAVRGPDVTPWRLPETLASSTTLDKKESGGSTRAASAPGPPRFARRRVFFREGAFLLAPGGV